MSFTLFNCCTLVVMALTVAGAVVLFRSARPGWFAVVYYGVVMGYAFGFKYSLNPYVVLAGAGLAGVSRWLRVVRWVELAVFGYVLFRCGELVLGL